MNRVPVYEVFEQRPVEEPQAGGGSVFRPLDGDECTVELTDVSVSPGGCAHSAVFGGAGDGTTSTVVMVLGEADCAADRGLEAVLSGMAAGEAREFRLGDGRGGCAAGRARLVAMRRRRAGAGWRDDDRRKLAEAARHKDAGNGLYRRARYADAFHRFNRAVRAVLFVRDADAAEARGPRDALYAAVCNNMAACQLHMANYEHARRLSDKALSVDPDNVKALVRRCRASVELGLYDAALADADRALSRDPGNAAARRYRNAAARGVLRQDGLYRDMVKRMFAG